jgi:hypothetical protein
MRKEYLFMAMSLDGFYSGLNGELDWLTTVTDKLLARDVGHAKSESANPR